MNKKSKYILNKYHNECQNELLYWIKIGNYINKTDKLDRLDFLYKQCKLHH